jgi:hypothetical protein
MGARLSALPDLDWRRAFDLGFTPVAMAQTVLQAGCPAVAVAGL